MGGEVRNRTTSVSETKHEQNKPQQLLGLINAELWQVVCILNSEVEYAHSFAS